MEGINKINSKQSAEKNHKLLSRTIKFFFKKEITPKQNFIDKLLNN